MFPAAATNRCPSSLATSKMEENAWLNPPPPQELQEILAPIARAHSRHSAASDMSPHPSASMNLQGLKEIFQFVPATPIPLLPSAPMIPATAKDIQANSDE